MTSEEALGLRDDSIRSYLRSIYKNVVVRLVVLALFSVLPVFGATSLTIVPSSLLTGPPICKPGFSPPQCTAYPLTPAVIWLFPVMVSRNLLLQKIASQPYAPVALPSTNRNLPMTDSMATDQAG